MAPLRLLIVSREYPPFVGGGIGAYAARWARLLAERAAAGEASGWGAPVVVTTGPEGRMVEAVEDGITVVRLPLVAWIAPRSAGGGGKGRGGSLHGCPPGRGGYPEGQPDWSRPHPAIATPEVEAAFRTFHPTAVFAMQVADALPQIVARHGIGAIEGPDTGAPMWFALNQRRRAGAWQVGKIAKWSTRSGTRRRSRGRRAENRPTKSGGESVTSPLATLPPPLSPHHHASAFADRVDRGDQRG
jgi:hypothetical protein